MKRTICISICLFLTLVAYGQELDSAEFRKVFNEVADVYKKNIDQYLVDLAKSKVPPLARDANKDDRQAHEIAISSKIYNYRLHMDYLLSESYSQLSKNLKKVGKYPKPFLAGYLDNRIKDQFPYLNNDFFETKVNSDRLLEP